LLQFTVTGGCDPDSTDLSSYTVPECGEEITITFEASDSCSSDSCTATFTVKNCSYCSYTQGFYGNEGGLGCRPEFEDRVNAQIMMEQALSNVGGTVYFGDYNDGLGNYFVITSADITNGNIFTWLPGGGPPKALKGETTYPKRIRNILLAQTVTLFFNIELNHDIGDWELESQFYTSESKGCGSEEGYYMTQTFNIPDSVMEYDGIVTVRDLYQLANDVLGGIVTDISAGDVNKAIDAINRGFDECRILRDEANSDEDPYPDSEDFCDTTVSVNDQGAFENLDTDGDLMGDVCDNDDDNDGVMDANDSYPLDPTMCQDLDGDDCDDCSVGTDGFGPLADFDMSNDGPDADGDGICDLSDACPFDADNDADGDGVCGDVDNCPSIYNPDQLDSDGDGMGDVCDTCPFDADNDADNDGVCGDIDNCPSIANPDQADSDGDSIGDVCDSCPEDETNTCNDAAKMAIKSELKTYPVPFNETLTVEYKYEYETDVIVRVFDTKGMLISSKTDETYVKGTIGSTELDLSRVADQTLIIKVISSQEVMSKMVISKSIEK